MHSGDHAVSRFGATILGVEGLRLGREERALIAEADPFGFILFARNIATPDQVRALCDELRAAVGRAAPITIDQEGGRVQRLRAPLWREWLPPLEQVAAAHHPAEAMYWRYRLIAADLHALGIDGNCAPLVDVIAPQTHDFLRNRCYGNAPASVSEIGRAVADGLLDGGVLPVVKHIPGHGRAVVDSHLELPVVEAGAAELGETDFAPFRALNDLPMAMTAHVVYAALDAAPATTSARMMRLIREEIGFDGLIMTDDISMDALSGSNPQIVRDALAAGCDVVLLCDASLSERAETAAAAGEMSDVAQARAEMALAARITPEPVDMEALDAKLSEAMKGPV